jgi:hypothetical protein
MMVWVDVASSLIFLSPQDRIDPNAPVDGFGSTGGLAQPD